MKKQKLSLYSGLFSGMVQEVNEKLSSAFAGMKEKQIEESTVTVKISLALAEKPVVTEDGGLRAVAVPVISYKLQSAMKFVTSSAGVMDTGGLELERAADGTYVLSPAVGSQIGMEEADEPEDADDALLAELAEEYGVDMETVQAVVAGEETSVEDIVAGSKVLEPIPEVGA